MKTILTNLSKVVRVVFLVAAVFAFGFPVYWIVNTSLKPNSEAHGYPPTWIPHQFTLKNYVDQVSPSWYDFGQPIEGTGEEGEKEQYVEVHTESYLPYYFLNGMIISLGVTLLAIVLATMAGYSFSRFTFPGKEGALMFFLSTQMFPYVALAIPIYIMYRALGLLNTYVGLIVAILGLVLPFAVWMTKAFCDTIEKDFEEAAIIEGAGRMRILATIIVPVIKPGIVSVALSSFLGAWKHLLYNLILGTDDKTTMIPLGMLKISWNVFHYYATGAATIVTVSLPVLVVFLVLQRHFVSGLTAGAVKG